jgi:DNA-binding response OmpR family regulator
MSRKILVIEDEPYVAKAIKFMLEGEGYEVVVAESGATALLIMKEYAPALVLLDMKMPGLCGFETLKCIKVLFKNIPVVMISAAMDENESKETMDAGACDYITKPIDFDRLKICVHSKCLE